jgi:IS30 family transposase
MGQYHHPGLAEREDIMMMRRERMGVREIARATGRDKSTVPGELARNSSPTGAAPYYGASTVRRKSERRRARCRRPRLTGDPERRALVVSKVRDDRWSPEQVEGRIRAGRRGAACLVTLVDRRSGYLAGGSRLGSRPRRSRRPMLPSTADRASAPTGSAPRRSPTRGRCTCYEDSPPKVTAEGSKWAYENRPAAQLAS